MAWFKPNKHFIKFFFSFCLCGHNVHEFMYFNYHFLFIFDFITRYNSPGFTCCIIHVKSGPIIHLKQQLICRRLNLDIFVTKISIRHEKSLNTELMLTFYHHFVSFSDNVTHKNIAVIATDKSKP
jgi:hypothetical protein